MSVDVRAAVVGRITLADDAVRAWDLLMKALDEGSTPAYRLEHFVYLMDRIDAAYAAGWLDEGRGAWEGSA